MVEWFNFALYALQQIVEMVFDLDVGLGFSLGDFEIALLLIGVIATALVVRIGSAASNEVDRAHSVHNRNVRSEIETYRYHTIRHDLYGD